MANPKDNNAQPRDKLGLALAGGGFRASLFHVGVLRRMAEQDLLRYLEVLSTVSGGSIVGALYILLLKRELENKALLSQEDYLRIVDDLELRLCRSIKKNLRMRLLMNPFGTLRVMLSGYSLGQRMSRLYERYIFSETVRELKDLKQPHGWLSWKRIPDWIKRLYAPGRIRLTNIKIHPGRYENINTTTSFNGTEHNSGKQSKKSNKLAMLRTFGIESYNQHEVANNGSVITQLIVNATSLNSGSRFWFSANEIGDSDHGNIRRGEITKILKRKKLITELLKRQSLLTRYHLSARRQAKPAYYHFAQWWILKDASQAIEGYEPLFDSFMTPVIELMRHAKPGILRTAKLSAWYLRIGYHRTPAISGGLSKEQLLYKVITALGNIGRVRLDKVDAWIRQDKKRCDLMLDFIIEMFLFRMAEHVSPSICSDWDKLTLGDAVAASSSFPPLFPPFQLSGIYDNIIVSRLGLTDGGVFDNIGFIGLLDEHCNQIIVSDTGGPLNKHQRSSSGRFGMSARIINIMSSTDARQSKRYLLDRYRISTELSRELHSVTYTQQVGENTNGTHLTDQCATCAEHQDHLQGIQYRMGNLLANRELLGLAMFSIDSRDACLQQNDFIPAEKLAQVRTDLDIFSDIEMYALMDQGYTNANHYINRYLVPETDDTGFLDPKDQYRYSLHPCPYNSRSDANPDNISHWRRALTERKNSLCDNHQKGIVRKLASNRNLIEDTIAAASKSFFRTLHMKILTPWVVLFAIFTSLILASENTQISVYSFLQSLHQTGAQNVTGLLSYLPDNWKQRSYHLSGIIILITSTTLLIYLIMQNWFRVVDVLKQHSWIRLSRFMAMMAHWPRSYCGNLLWLVWLPLPLLLATSLSCIVISNHAFYYWVVLPKQSLRKK